MSGRSPTDGDQIRSPGSTRSRRLAVGWITVVVIASVVDPGVVLELAAGLLGSTTDAASGTAAGGVTRVAGIDPFAVAHFVAYGVLAWLLAGGIGGADVGDGFGSRRLLVAVALASLVGVGVELLQAPIAVRSASAVDAGVNMLGAIAGGSAYYAVRRWVAP